MCGKNVHTTELCAKHRSHVYRRKMRLWQHDETGRITALKFQPSKRWYEIPTMYEDELPEDISDELYSWWFDNSFVDGVQMGPKI